MLIAAAAATDDHDDDENWNSSESEIEVAMRSLMRGGSRWERTAAGNENPQTNEREKREERE